MKSQRERERESLFVVYKKRKVKNNNKQQQIHSIRRLSRNSSLRNSSSINTSRCRRYGRIKDKEKVCDRKRKRERQELEIEIDRKRERERMKDR